MTEALRRVALVGPRGAGKSTVAPLLAAELGFESADADAELAIRAGMAAGDYLRRFGEPAFRALEVEVTGALLRRSGVVVATGGGAVLDDGLRRLLGQKGTFCVLLLADPAVLVQRLSLSPSERPSLTGLPLAREVEALLHVRLPLYRAVATVEVDTGNGSPVSVACSIAARARALPR